MTGWIDLLAIWRETLRHRKEGWRLFFRKESYDEVSRYPQ